MPSCLPAIERAKPLLGTFVSLRVHGLAPAAAKETMNRCFAEAAHIHRLMSFQEPDSDISRLNREAYRRPVRVDGRTYEVLGHAAAVSAQSDGAFDVTVAPSLVAANIVGAPPFSESPDPSARWSDVLLLPEQQVRFLRPLWIDVSGVAKGYAVDRLAEILAGSAAAQACVNAGGDLRVFGPEAEWVGLDTGADGEDVVPMVEIKNGSMASSGERCPGQGAVQGPDGRHVDGATRRPSTARFVSVLAPTCVIADALTKVVMARGGASRKVLRHFAASALFSDDARGWLEVG